MNITSEFGSRFKLEFVSQIFVAISVGSSTIVLARFLEPNSFGLLFLSMSIFSVVQVFSRLGIATAASRYITEYREVDPSQIPHIIHASFKSNIILISGISLIYFFSHESITTFISSPELIPFLKIGTFYIIFQSLFAYIRTILQGLEDVELASIIQIVNQGGRLLFAVALVFLGFGALGALGGYIVGTILATLLGLYFISDYTYLDVSKSNKMEDGLFRRILSYTIPTTITRLSDKIDNKIDIIMVAFFLNPLLVSYYAIGKQLVGFVQIPATTVGFSIAPSYGRQKASDQISRSSRTYEKTLIYTLLLILPASVGVVILARPIVEILLGNKYNSATPVLQTFSLYMILQAVTKITDFPLDYLGRAKARAMGKGIASISNVFLNILLIPMIGVIGAVIATIITQLFYTSVLLYVITRELNLDFGLIFRKLSMVTTVTIGMGAVVWILSVFVIGPATLFLVIFGGVITWFILSIIIGLFDYNRTKKHLYNIV